MESNLLQFVKVAQSFPNKRDAHIRVHDFQEIYKSFESTTAIAQAGRCGQCGVPFCQVHCPLGNNIPDWLRLVAEERFEEAYHLSQATNNFPEVCGRICPQDRLCEGNCVIEKGFGSVTIGSIETFLSEQAWQNGWVNNQVQAQTEPFSIAIIGAGPAGLSAAEQLCMNGYAVHVYDRYDRLGGLMMYGIPSFKLEKHVVIRRVARLENMGVVFHCNSTIGENILLTDLQKQHDAVLIATGVYKARDLDGIDGNQLHGVVAAMDFLTAANRKSLGDDVAGFDNGTLNAINKNVVVIGGGDTAMDCVRTSIRQQAASVTCVYRRDRRKMPGSKREVKHAEEEGVFFQWLSAPIAFIGDDKVSAIDIRIADTLSESDKAILPNIDFSIAKRMPADLVVKALGFDPDDIVNLFDLPELAVTTRGTVAINQKTMMTNLPGVFAAGDIVRGASLVVWAIRDGRDAAAQIHKWIQNTLKDKARIL